MQKYSQQDFVRLTKDKEFAYGALLFDTSELLRSAIELYIKNPHQNVEIIALISNAIDRHLDSKDKYKVVHEIFKKVQEVTVIKRLMPSNKGMIDNFIGRLNGALQYIEDKEDGKIEERRDILQAIQKTKSPRKKPPTGFISTLTDDQIKLLYQRLLGNLIDSETTLENFKSIFKNAPLPPAFRPIKRTKSFTKALLAYFVYIVFQRKNQTDYWSIAGSCFYDAKGLKQTLNLIFKTNKKSKPRGSEEIDNILKETLPGYPSNW
jgi:hypothetical protein